jgi:hypothetical protein
MSTTAKATMWEPWTVIHKCFIGPEFEVSGNDDDGPRCYICDATGRKFGDVDPNEYPDGTTFTVEVTITPHPPKHKKEE